jgi:hypothetical protein
MVTMACFYFILIFYKDLQKYMTSDIDSNGVLTRKEKEELVLDLYFNQNKTYHEWLLKSQITVSPTFDIGYTQSLIIPVSLMSVH